MAGKFVSPKAKESLMTDILVKLFVKDYKDVEKVSVRTAYGVLASGVGIFCNVLLTIAKMVIGILLHSVSVTADAFNNLSDAGSSIIGMIGVKMAEKLADKIFLMDVHAPRVASHCEPGQFVIVKMDEKGERIPLTICDYDREAGTITIVVQEVGASTTKMGTLKEGDYFRDFTGPLGCASEFVHEDLETLKNKKCCL